MEDKYIYKLIILGDTYVGKSTFISKYTNRKDDLIGSFTGKGIHNINLIYNPTIGADFYTCLDRDVSGRLIKCHIWDTAGQEIYRSITTGYFKKAAGAILMYDVTNEKSFISLEYWINILLEHTKLENLSLIIVGNKTDMNCSRCVRKKDGEGLASKYEALYMECSVVNGENIDKIIPRLINLISVKHLSDVNREISGIKVLHYQKGDESNDEYIFSRNCCIVL